MWRSTTYCGEVLNSCYGNWDGGGGGGGEKSYRQLIELAIVVKRDC